MASLEPLVFPVSQVLPLADGSYLQVIEYVRTVPGKRAVCRCVWNGLNVYAKVFIGRQAARYAERDAAGVNFLSEVNIKTPTLLLDTKLLNLQARVLIFAEVQGAINAEQAYKKAGDSYLLLKSLVTEVALLHQHKILQTDLYLKNFLVDGDEIYTLDGDGIRQYRFLSPRRALKNLAVLISKFDVLEVEQWLPSLLQVYATARNWSSVPDLTAFKRLVNQHRTQVGLS